MMFTTYMIFNENGDVLDFDYILHEQHMDIHFLDKVLREEIYEEDVQIDWRLYNSYEEKRSHKLKKEFLK